VKILVRADRSGAELRPVIDHLRLPLIPIAGRPLLCHTLDALADMESVKAVTVLVAADDRQTPLWLRSRDWTRFSIRCVTALPTDAAFDVVVRGDLLRHPADLHRAVRAGADLGLGVGARAGDVAWPIIKRRVEDHPGTQALVSLRELHQVMIAGARFGYGGADSHGWLAADGVKLGVGAAVSTMNPAARSVLVGDRARVSRAAVLGADVVIGDDCYVGRGSRLQNAAVLPRSEIGPGLVVDNAMVAGPWLISFTHDCVVRVTDRAMLKAA
jgi:hypothetical protein